jgi:hypothetical protein
MKKHIVRKIKIKFRSIVVTLFRKNKIYPKIYLSYWNYFFSRNNKSRNDSNYYAAIPNPGAGIGHQMGNWISAYWFAQEFNLRFAHIPFSNPKWDYFLGFGEKEITVSDLLKMGYKKVTLPLFNEYNIGEVTLIKNIISSYSNKKVVFIAEQDQAYCDQCGVLQVIREKFHSAAARTKDQLVFDKESFNIAIHIRRGDIVVGKDNKNENLLLRWQGNDYFIKVLQTTIKNLNTIKPISIYLFSQGNKRDFPEFEHFTNLHYCLEMSAQDSFLHMVNADLLITSKSSFSYKPALLSKGIKICPMDFWHRYPDNEKFILVNNMCEFDIKKLNMFNHE